MKNLQCCVNTLRCHDLTQMAASSPWITRARHFKQDLKLRSMEHASHDCPFVNISLSSIEVGFCERLTEMQHKSQ